MNEQTRAQAIVHARAAYPREACGLVVIGRGRERYWPCENRADGTDHFVMDARDYAAAEEAGDVVAVVHSHPNAQPDPSQADRVACEASGLPWFIVGIPNERWAELRPVGYQAPLVGRQFSHGVLDCYALIRDHYAQALRIALPDFERADNWWHRGGNLYIENFQRAGFSVVSGEPQANDVLLMQVQSKVPNHGAVYLGDGMILHHLHGRLSCREPFGGYWQKHCTHILRHHKCAT